MKIRFGSDTNFQLFLQDRRVPDVEADDISCTVTTDDADVLEIAQDYGGESE